MASEVVEKVAKAIVGSMDTSYSWQEAVEVARAAIAAMREPTQRMILVPAIIEHGKPWTYYWSDQFDQELASRAKYQAMIDEALKD